MAEDDDDDDDEEEEACLDTFADREEDLFFFESRFRFKICLRYVLYSEIGPY